MPVSTQYREGAKKPIPSNYTTLKNKYMQCCQGQCTCDIGTRTNYDKAQYKINVLHKDVKLPLVTRIPGWQM